MLRKYTDDEIMKIQAVNGCLNYEFKEEEFELLRNGEYTKAQNNKHYWAEKYLKEYARRVKAYQNTKVLKPEFDDVTMKFEKAFVKMSQLLQETGAVIKGLKRALMEKEHQTIETLNERVFRLEQVIKYLTYKYLTNEEQNNFEKIKDDFHEMIFDKNQKVFNLMSEKDFEKAEQEILVLDHGHQCNKCSKKPENEECEFAAEDKCVSTAGDNFELLKEPLASYIVECKEFDQKKDKIDVKPSEGSEKSSEEATQENKEAEEDTPKEI